MVSWQRETVGPIPIYRAKWALNAPVILVQNINVAQEGHRKHICDSTKGSARAPYYYNYRSFAIKGCCNRGSDFADQVDRRQNKKVTKLQDKT